MSIFLDVMKEELERNLFKQNAFLSQIQSLPKGYLSECKIDNRVYIYRKNRIGKKIVSEYIGVPDDNNVKRAIEDRKLYMDLKQSIKVLKNEENRLRKAIKQYEKLWNWNE